MTDPRDAMPLKPCPFCGGTEMRHNMVYGAVQCVRCEATGPAFPSSPDAPGKEAEGWNARAALEAREDKPVARGSYTPGELRELAELPDHAIAAAFRDVAARDYSTCYASLFRAHVIEKARAASPVAADTQGDAPLYNFPIFNEWRDAHGRYNYAGKVTKDAMRLAWDVARELKDSTMKEQPSDGAGGTDGR